VTRGAAERDHAFPKDVRPTVLIMSRPLTTGAELQRVGAITVPDNRWGRCDIKSTSLLANVLLRNEALAAGAQEAILIRDGCVTEGASSNVFVVRAGRVCTPPLSALILAGVTRALLIEVLRGMDVVIEEAEVTAEALAAADEIWLTSSTRDLLWLDALDGRRLPTPPPGTAVAERAYAAFQAYKRRVTAG
jgi:D-alanine transaminase